MQNPSGTSSGGSWYAARLSRRRPGSGYGGGPQEVRRNAREPVSRAELLPGPVSENLEDPGTQIFDVIRYFGERKKIFNVHFRNIRGHRNDFVAEIFPDEGSVDFVKAVRVYRDVGYDGMLMPDHVPLGSPEAELQNFAYAYGYIRRLMQSADESV